MLEADLSHNTKKARFENRTFFVFTTPHEATLSNENLYRFVAGCIRNTNRSSCKVNQTRTYNRFIASKKQLFYRGQDGIEPDQQRVMLYTTSLAFLYLS
jgi:hypothetical protein